MEPERLVERTVPWKMNHQTLSKRFHPNRPQLRQPDRKSTRLNSSHLGISYAVFCLKKNSHIDLCLVCTYAARTRRPARGHTVGSNAPIFFFLIIGRPRNFPLFPYTPLSR